MSDGGVCSIQIRSPKSAPETKRVAPHYQHSEIGYNYRLSNVLAAPKGPPGRGQLRVLEERVQARRRIFDYYEESLGQLPGIRFMPKADWGRHTRWLTCITVNPDEFGATSEDLRLAMEAENIEARPRPGGSREADASPANLCRL